MTKQKIIEILIRIHRKYSGDRKSTINSEMCALWSTDDPPDELEDTPQLDEIEVALDFGFTEDEAVEFYDMHIGEAAGYIFKIIKKK